MIRRPLLASLLACLPTLGVAEVPQVVTDIAPVHSLTAIVMGDLGTPDLLLQPGQSPHDHAFRPTEAQALAGAGLVIWVGPGLTPWLEEPIGTLAPGAPRLTLTETAGWTPLPLRTDPLFAEGDEDHDHDHETGADPHAWLDPAVASVWLGVIAEALADADPANAAIYRGNAETAQGTLAGLAADLTTELQPLQGRAYVTPHDAYQYFETAFALPAAGAIALGDAAAPGPQTIADLRARIEAQSIACVLTDSQTNPGWAALLAEGTGIRVTAIDDLGLGLTPGAELYPALLRGIAASLQACLN